MSPTDNAGPRPAKASAKRLIGLLGRWGPTIAASWRGRRTAYLHVGADRAVLSFEGWVTCGSRVWVTNRPCYLAGLVTLTGKLIDALALASATVDGFTDCRDLPRDAAEALARLEEVAAEKHGRDAATSRWYRWLRRKGPTNMAVEFDLGGPVRYVVEQFAPYSIHAALRDAKVLIEVVLHDSGTGVSISTDSPADEARVARVLDEAAVPYGRSEGSFGTPAGSGRSPGRGSR